MDKIDLNSIMDKFYPRIGQDLDPDEMTKECMKEAIHQALVLASEKAKIKKQKKSTIVHPNYDEIIYEDIIDKQSILDVDKLIV